MIDLNSNFFQRLQLIGIFDSVDELVDVCHFLVRLHDGRIRNALSFKLIKVFRNSSHQTKLRNEQDFLLVFLVLDFEHRLFEFFDRNSILVFEVLKNRCLSAFKHGGLNVREVNIDNSIVL